MKYAALDRHIPVSRIGKGTVTLPGNGLDIRVFLTLDQVEEFLALAATQTPYWYPMFKLVAETGLRWGEAAGLPAANLDLRRGSVLINQSLKLDGRGNWTIGLPKGGRWRRLGLDEGTVDALRTHLTEHPPRTHLLGGQAHALAFTNPDGRPLDRSNFRRDAWRPLVDSIAWLPRGLRFHDLRHSHISILLDLGTPVGDVASRAGHASAKMTQDRYGHAMPHADDRAMDRLAAAKAPPVTEARTGFAWCRSGS